MKRILFILVLLFAMINNVSERSVEVAAQVIREPKTDNSNASRKEIRVSTTDEFIKTIGSNKTIKLAPGTYNLTQSKLANLPKGLSWEEVFDGKQLNLNGIKNLTIEGSGSKPSELIVEPRYAFVLNFTDSANIKISNIKAGHSPGGYCSGGVFAFSSCKNINIDNTHMYGCGTEGLNLESVNNMTVSYSSIYQCTYQIMTVINSANINFKNCKFYDNKEFSLINLNKSKNIIMDACYFTDNHSSETFFGLGKNTNVVVKNSHFVNNQTKSLDASNSITFENCNFKGNDWEHFNLRGE